MKKLILVQAILVLLFCQYSTAFSFNGAMNSLALQIFTQLTDKEVSQNELYGQDGMTKLAQQIKVAAQHRQNGTTPLKTGPLMGVRNPTANQSNEKAAPEDKMTKLAKSIASAFAASQPQQNTNKTQNTTNNSTSPVKPVVIVPEVKQNNTNTTQPAQNTTVPEPVVIVEVNKTQETNQTVQNNTTVTEPVIVAENNKTQETNQTAQTNQTSQQPTQTSQQPTQTNQTTTQVNQTKPTLPPVHSTHPIGIEKTETPKLEVEAECGAQIEHSLAIISDLGIHAATGNVDKVRRDYDALKAITISLNKACSKSFSINIKPRPFFNNTGICESELSELQKLAANFNNQNSKDMISFAKTLQNFWYRHGNFVSSCVDSTSTTIGIEKPETPKMEVEAECGAQIEHSLAIIYNLGVHAAAENVEKVRRDYDALKTITLSLNKACSKSFSINIKPHPFFNNTGVCGSELSELQKLAVNYNQNSKDMISFAKTLQNFWYRHGNFVSSCLDSPVTPIGIEKTEVPEMKVEDECAHKIEHSLAIIYDLGVHAAAENVDHVRRDFDALKTITLNLNKVCEKSFSINIKPHPFFNNSGVCGSELSELQKLAINFNQNSKDKISFAKTIQNFWYRHINFVSSCVESPAAPIGIEKTEVPQMKVEDECATKIEHSLAIIYNLGVHSAAENVEKVRRDYDALKTITIDLNKVCSKSFSINTHPHPFFNNTGICGSELSELQKLAANYNQNSKDKISFAKTLQNFWYRHQNFVSSCVENTTNTTQSTQSTQQSEEQRETQCILSFAEAISAVNKMNGKIASWSPSSTKTMINNLNTRVSSINNFCSAKLSVNVESTQTAQGNCQKDTVLLKTAVENFTSENSKDLVRVSQALREISSIGKQILIDC